MLADRGSNYFKSFDRPAFGKAGFTGIVDRGNIYDFPRVALPIFHLLKKFPRQIFRVPAGTYEDDSAFRG